MTARKQLKAAPGGKASLMASRCQTPRAGIAGHSLGPLHVLDVTRHSGSDVQPGMCACISCALLESVRAAGSTANSTSARGTGDIFGDQDAAQAAPMPGWEAECWESRKADAPDSERPWGFLLARAPTHPAWMILL